MKMIAPKQQVKEGKNKKNVKVISKPQIVLANPVKLKVPSLNNDEFEKLQNLLLQAIEGSKLSGQAFATAVNINIGLESTLRAINNCKAGCVFLSTNIKPKYVLGLIARNAESKDEQVPVYVQEDLENVTKNIFNISALALTLPKVGKGLNEELLEWIRTHLRPKSKKVPTALHSKLTKLKAPKTLYKNATTCVKSKVDSLAESVAPSKPKATWAGDYISFSNEQPMDTEEAPTENAHEQLEDALCKMIDKVNRKTTAVKTSEVNKHLPAAEETAKATATNEQDEEDDEFYGSYAPLTLHKILPKTNRKPRRKRCKDKKAKKKC